MKVRYTTYTRRSKTGFVETNCYELPYGIIKPPSGNSGSGMIKDCRKQLANFYITWKQQHPEANFEVSELFTAYADLTVQQKTKTLPKSIVAKEVYTPLGKFDTQKAAAAAHGRSPFWLSTRMRKEPDKYYLKSIPK